MKLRTMIVIAGMLSFVLPAGAQFRRLNLSGKVTLPDGSPPPDRVLIRLYCEGRREPQGYTDSKGRFSFAVGGNLLGETRVRMADQALKLMPHLAEAHYYRAVASASLGDIDATEESLRAIQASPDAARYPRTHFMMANVYLQRRDIKNAARELRTYVKLEPNSRAGKASKKQLAEWEARGLIKKAP